MTASKSDWFLNRNIHKSVIFFLTTGDIALYTWVAVVVERIWWRPLIYNWCSNDEFLVKAGSSAKSSTTIRIWYKKLYFSFFHVLHYLMLRADDFAKCLWIVSVEEYILSWILFGFVFHIFFHWIPGLVYVNTRAENVNSAKASWTHPRSCFVVLRFSLNHLDHKASPA